MSNRTRIVLRRSGAILVGLLGMYVVASAVIPLVDGFRSRSREFMNNIPILVAIAVFIFAIGIKLLFAARRLWRLPASSVQSPAQRLNKTLDGL